MFFHKTIQWLPLYFIIKTEHALSNPLRPNPQILPVVCLKAFAYVALSTSPQFANFVQLWLTSPSPPHLI